MILLITSGLISVPLPVAVTLFCLSLHMNGFAFAEYVCLELLYYGASRWLLRNYNQGCAQNTRQPDT